MGLFSLNSQNRTGTRLHRLIYAGLAWVIASAFLALCVPRVAAQSQGDFWGTPVNLSQSGAASQPRIVASPDGRLQAFWWDQFDGLVTAVFDGENWSEPRLAPIRSQYLEQSPVIISDSTGSIHALWIEQVDVESRLLDDEIHTLMSTQMEFGSSDWVTPQAIAESAVVFDVSASAAGEVYVTYLRTNHTPDLPAGIYVKSNPGKGAAWNSAVAAFTSIYYRLLDGDQTRIDLQAASEEAIFVSWNDPRSRQAYLMTSQDLGKTWSDRITLHPDGGPDTQVKFALLPEGDAVMRLTQSPRDQGCAISQSILTISELAEMNRDSEAGEYAFETSGDCPGGEGLLSTPEGFTYLWGEGSEQLSLSAWDQDSQHWSLPAGLSVSFIDEQAQRIDLGDLHPSLQDSRLVVVGTDTFSGEIWAVEANLSALEIAQAGPPVWSKAEILAQTEGEILSPILLSGPEDRLHVFWAQQENENSPASIYYAGWDGREWSQEEKILTSVQGLSGPPAAAVLAGERLGLAWAAGQPAQVFFSWSNAAGARNRVEWSEPIAVSESVLATSSPSLAVDEQGKIYLAYTVPFNEQRGVYLTWSEDLGQSWSEAVQVFDGAAAGWEKVDRPQLSVGPDNKLCLAWSRFFLASKEAAEQVDYACSEDGGLIWSTPEVLLQGAIEPNPLLFSTPGMTHTAWLERGPNRLELRHKQAAQGSSAWESTSPVILLMPQPAPAGMAVDAGGGMYLLWGEQDNRSRWQLSGQVWNGERWTPQKPLDLEMTQTLSGLVPLVSADGHLNVVYQVWTVDPDLRRMQNLLLFSRRLASNTGIEPGPGEVISPQGQANPQHTTNPVEQESTQTDATPQPTPEAVTAPVDLSQLQTDVPSGGSRWMGLAIGGGLALAAIVLVLGLRFLLLRGIL